VADDVLRGLGTQVLMKGVDGAGAEAEAGREKAQVLFVFIELGLNIT